MKWRRVLALALGLAVFGALVSVVLAQLTDTQTATGTITATSTSSDLYICEPGVIAGPACGADDSGADELVFETVEDIRPGEIVEWDLRLRNVGTDDITLLGVNLTITETLDPGGGCTGSSNLIAGSHPATGIDSDDGVFILGKSGDDINDNAVGLNGVASLVRESGPTDDFGWNVRIAPGDYEDLRLRIETQLDIAIADACEGNEWSVDYEFVAG